MLEKIKQYWETILGALLLIASGAFLYEKSKRNSADAIADNEEDLQKLNAIQKEVSSNDGKLEAEEAKRAEIKKEADASHDDDSSDFLKRR